MSHLPLITTKIWKDVAISQSTEIKHYKTARPNNTYAILRPSQIAFRSQSAGFASQFSEQSCLKAGSESNLLSTGKAFVALVFFEQFKQAHQNLTSGMKFMKLLWFERSPTIHSIWTKTQVHQPSAGLWGSYWPHSLPAHITAAWHNHVRTQSIGWCGSKYDL